MFIVFESSLIQFLLHLSQPQDILSQMHIRIGVRFCYKQQQKNQFESTLKDPILDLEFGVCGI